MTKRSEMSWRLTKLLSSIFLVSVLLHSSLGYSFYEDEYPSSQSAFYQYLQDGMWNMHQKIPRGYMVPMPRVGRRRITEEKRQNMIPQPRIGRQLEINNELVEVLSQVQNFLPSLKNDISTDLASSKSNMLNELNPDIYNSILASDASLSSDDDITKILPRELLYHGKESSTAKDSNDFSVLENEDGLKVRQNSNAGNRFDSAMTPNIDERELKLDAMDTGFDIFEEEKRQGLIPAARIGRDRLLTAFDEKRPSGSMLAYPRIGRRFWELPILAQTLIPYPRAGRYVTEPEFLDYDILLNPDYGTSGLDDTFTDALLNSQPVVEKRRNVKLIPRIGRKKRSVSNEQSNQEDQAAKDNDQAIPNADNSRYFLNDLDDIDEDYFFRSDKKGMRSKSAFVPRIGKKKSNDFEDLEEKRAAAFTPRIGRASLVPRIGRNDPRFRLMSRAAFVPRIGRRAAFVPRIGRSKAGTTENEVE